MLHIIAFDGNRTVKMSDFQRHTLLQMFSQQIEGSLLPTCSLTEARMAEVVSVSDPSPLEAFSTGLNMLEFSEGWSGTGITSAEPRQQSQKVCTMTSTKL